MNKMVLIIAPIMLAVGLAGGYWSADSKQALEQAAISSVERKIIFYRNPMNPSVTSAVAAKDSMGMDYIPVYAEDNADRWSYCTKYECAYCKSR